MNWNDVSIGQYQLLAELNPKNDKIDNELLILSIVNKKPIDYYEALPLSEVENELKKIQFVNTPPISRAYRKWRHKGYIYKFVLEPRKMQAQQFIHLQKLLAEGQTANLHKIMALFTVKTFCGIRIPETVEGFEKRAELFRDKMSVQKSMGYMLFFSTYFIRLYETTLQYLKAEKEKGHGLFGLTMQEKSAVDTPR